MEQWKLQKITQFLIENNKSIAIAESVTSGEITFQFLQKDLKINQIFKGSVVMQNVQAHQAILKLSPGLLKKYGLISREVSIETALAIGKLLSVNLAIGICGNLSKTNYQDKEPGTVYFTIAYEDLITNFSLKIQTDNIVEKNSIVVDQIIEELYKILFES